MCNVENITKIAHYLKVPVGKLSYNDEKVVTRTTETGDISGFTTILSALEKESTSEAVRSGNATPEIQAQVQQWIDYAVLYVAAGAKDKHVSQHLLKDLNAYLGPRSYFVEYAMTLADLAIFYTIYDLMKSLSPVEKENYLNLSRWFNHLQKNVDILQGDELLNFTTIYLHGWATGTHL